MHLMPAYGLALVVYLIAISWSQPILDLFGFRQAQTALSAYWLVRGAPFWSYITPVTGYPWSIPFEVPVYQLLVAEFAPGTSLIDIDRTGRVLSVGFFLAACALVYRVALLWSGDRRTALLCMGALLASPLMAFWSRAVMIESTALCLGIAFVWCLAEYARSPRWGWLVCAVPVACAGALVKITTFFGFAFFAAGAIAIQWMVAGDAAQRRRAAILAVYGSVAILLSLLSLKVWLLHADALKAQTLWGDSLGSSQLGGWNYGTWPQRLDVGFWRKVALSRSVRDGLGSPWLLPMALAIVLAARSTRIPGVLLFISYLMPFAVFTNLHQVHDYYQYANMVFATTLLALAIRNVADIPRVGSYLGALFVLLVCVLSWQHTWRRYVPEIASDMRSSREMRIASFLKQETDPGSVLLVLGLDWDAALPYYAERRAVMMPDWVGVDRFKALTASSRPFGGNAVGAVVRCPGATPADPERSSAIDALVERYSRGQQVHSVADCQVIVASREKKHE
ncbi:hypothetical protein [Lysobacter niastensis]